MVASVVYQVPEAEFAQVVRTSPSVSQVVDRLGGGSASTVKKRIKELGLELGKSNGHSAKQQKKQQPRKQEARQQSRQQRRLKRQQSRLIADNKTGWTQGIPWPVILSLVAVGGVAFAVNRIAQADSTPGANLQGDDPRIDELKTWFNQLKLESDNRYQQLNAEIDELPKGNTQLLETAQLADRNQDAIRQLELKKIPSLEDTKQILSDITTQSNQFQAAYNEAQTKLNNTESQINKLESEIKKALEEAKKEGVTVETKSELTFGGRLMYGLGGLVSGIFIAGLLDLGAQKIIPGYTGAGEGNTIGAGAFVGAAWGLLGAWPIGS